MSKSDIILSHSGVKYKNKKKGQEILLSSLLQCYGNDEHLIRGFYKKIKGYGLKQIEFGENVTLFRHNKTDLFINYFIELIETKNGKYYSITPIGLINYCKIKESFEDYDITALLRFLEFHYKQSKSKYNLELSKSLSKIIKNTPAFDLRYAFYEIVSPIKIKDVWDIITIDCIYQLYSGLDISVTAMHYLKPDKEYFLDFDINFKKTFRESKIITYETCNRLIAQFIIKAFLHDIHTYNLELLSIPKPKTKRDTEISMKDIKEIKKSLNSFDNIALDIVKQFNDELKSCIEIHSKHLDIIN